MAKKVIKTGSSCGVSSWCVWLLPLIILVVALVPTWYAGTWGKWVIGLAALSLLIKKWFPGCCK